jgi:hypothetical protein
MQTPPPFSPRETTEAMVRNIGRELAEMKRAMIRCRGDAQEEPSLTDTLRADRLISSNDCCITY